MSQEKSVLKEVIADDLFQTEGVKGTDIEKHVWERERLNRIIWKTSRDSE